MNSKIDIDMGKVDGCCVGMLIGYALVVLLIVFNCSGGIKSEKIERLTEAIGRVENLRKANHQLDVALANDSVYRELLNDLELTDTHDE